MTQKEFAARVGKTRNAVAKYELGLVMPPADVLLKTQIIEKSHKP